MPYQIQFRRDDIVLLALAILVAIGIFLLDLMIPLGVAAGVPYVAVVLIGAWLPWRYGIISLAAISTALTILGYLLSPEGSVFWVVFTNRIIALLTIWLTAFLLIQRRRAEEALKSGYESLEAKVAERTMELQRANTSLAGANTGLAKQVAEIAEGEAALRESETRLHGVMDNVVDGIITIDEQGVIESLNRAAELLFGHPAERIRGKNVKVLMPEPHHSKHDDYIANYRHTGEAKIIGIGPREVLGLRKDGSTFPLELAVSAMDIGSKRCFIGVARDISLRKETEAQLQQAQKMEMIGQLTGGVAHDFNNLLTAIIGGIELLEEHIGEAPEARRNLEIARRGALRGADLTHRLLAFSRKDTLNPKPTEMNRLVTGMADLLGRTLGEHIEIETVLAGGLWQAIIDSNLLENALLNLSINARDAMPEGGKLTIETANTRLDEAYARNHEEVIPGQYVMVAVSDTGTGMSPEVLERAFDPFYTTKEVGKGTGLGLSTVFGFVKQSGGHIKLYSEVGQGTTVKLYLPRVMGNGERQRAVEAHPRTQPMGDETILVVEDDPDVRMFVVSALRVLGYTILEAHDGPQALALLEDKPHIDMLLTDVVLPSGMNGRDVAEEVQKIYPQTKVLFSSGYTENAIVHHGRLDADAELLAKPYTRETLAITVRRVLDS